MLAALQPRPVPEAASAAAATNVALPPLPAGPLNEAESKALFARFGVPVTREIVAVDAAAAQAAAEALGGRVVLKVLSREIAHKSDVGGVRVGVAAADIPAACATMLDSLRRAGAPAPEGFLVQELVKGSAEMILGFHRDPQLGPAILLGMGGVAAELFQDNAIRLLPLTRADAEAMLRELKTWPLLDGFRGAPRCDVAALVDAVLGFAAMAAAARRPAGGGGDQPGLRPARRPGRAGGGRPRHPRLTP